MRIPRRGTIAQRKGGGYVWAVYSLAPGVDESVYTTGSFTMTASILSTPYLMAADGYTVNSSGTITLTSATRTNVSALAAGKYIVSISSSSSTTTTSTQYVYKVTDVAASGSLTVTYTVSYERYEIDHNAKGEDTGERVTSATQDYPVDGLHTDGRWYVLLKGTVTAHIWDTYEVIDNGWSANQSKPSASNPPMGIATKDSSPSNKSAYELVTDGSTLVYYKSGSTLPTISADGVVTFTNSTTLETLVDTLWPGSVVSGGFFALNKNEKSHFYRGKSSSGANSVGALYRYDIYHDLQKGTGIGVVISETPNAYPQDGAQNDVWYVYSHYGEITIDNT